MTKTVKFAFAAGLLMMMSTMLNAQAGRKADKDTEEWRYEIECAGTGAEGTYLIKVWSFSKKPQVAMEQCKKNAVHGVVFKGFGGGQGCTSQKPLARSTNADEQFERYFENFFADGGSYMKYVSLTSQGTGTEKVKVSKKEYKVGVVVTVQKDLLRRDLENAGIIKGLSSGF